MLIIFDFIINGFFLYGELLFLVSIDFANSHWHLSVKFSPRAVLRV